MRLLGFEGGNIYSFINIKQLTIRIFLSCDNHAPIFLSTCGLTTHRYYWQAIHYHRPHRYT